MNVLITGGAGFIGTATGRALLDRGHAIRIMDTLLPPVHPKDWDRYGAPGSTFVRGDVRDAGDLMRVLRGIDVVLHMAAYQDFRTDWSTFFEVNAAGAARIYELIVRERLPVERVVLASSQAVLGEGAYTCSRHLMDGCGRTFYGVRRDPARMARGDWHMYCPTCGAQSSPNWTEEEEVAPAIPYGVSKLAAEQVTELLGRQYGIPTVNLRYSIVQGATQSPKNAYSGVLRAVALQLWGRTGDVVLFEDGMQLRDFVAVDDVVRANVMAVEGKVPDGHYNVGGDVAWPLIELATAMRDFAGSDQEITTPGFYRVGDIRHTLSKSAKIRQHGWAPDVDMMDCWKEYWEWFQTIITPNEARDTINGAFSGMMASGALKEAAA